MVSSSLLAGGIALILGLGLVITLGVLSIVSGGLHFLFARPKLDILKTQLSENGFAFGMKWNGAREPAKFNQVKLRLFNPFGSPSQVEIVRDFPAKDRTFAFDVDMGSYLRSLLDSEGLEKATVEVEVSDTKSGISQFFSMKGQEFVSRKNDAVLTADEYNEKHAQNVSKPVFHTPKRSFIADPLPKSNKVLKIASNPEFAGQFAGAAAADAPAVENFSVSKVWIEPGCIVCDACEAIYPEVFEVTDDTCIIRPDAPLNDGLKIQDAVEACPVEVIKFKAS
jgi:ferredoxin